MKVKQSVRQSQVEMIIIPSTFGSENQLSLCVVGKGLKGHGHNVSACLRESVNWYRHGQKYVYAAELILNTTPSRSCVYGVNIRTLTS